MIGKGNGSTAKTARGGRIICGMASLALVACLVASVSGCAPSTDAGATGPDMSSYSEDVQVLYAEYESGDLSYDELIGGYDVLLNQGEIDEGTYDELCDIAQQGEEE